MKLLTVSSLKFGLDHVKNDYSLKYIFFSVKDPKMLCVWVGGGMRDINDENHLIS